MELTRELVEKARSPSVWDVGNRVLYDLCAQHPHHDDLPSIIAKVWLIGRSYAAAIERRRDKADQNDSFYENKVGPQILRSDIDKWLESVADVGQPSAESLNSIVAAHGKVTSLFHEITGQQKRSLASKYLHFHFPALFYIYDTRAVEALRLVVVGPQSGHIVSGDHEYGRFAGKCLALQQRINNEFGIMLTPREMDNLFLQLYAGNGHAGASNA